MSEDNTIHIKVQLSEDDPDEAIITSSANFADDMSEDVLDYYSSLVMGINYMINFKPSI